MGRTPRDPWDRYIEKVSVGQSGDCWPWTAGRFEKGYGAFRLGAKQMQAHRFGYIARFGPIGDGLIVCHRCDNPPCQNPAHWFLGTHGDNADDRDTKGRGRYPRSNRVHRGRARGERHGRTPLIESDVRQIRSAYAAGVMSQDQIAAKYGVSQRAISNIVRRLSWDHVN